MKIKLKWLIPLLSIPSLTVLSSCSSYKKRVNEDNSINNEFLKIDNTLNSFTSFKEKIISKQKRQPNNQFYNSLLTQKYAKDGFNYPGYNNSYKEEKNRYIISNGQKIDLMEEVMNERVFEDIKYNNPVWLNSQIYSNDGNLIKNPNIKKHLAVNNFYANNVLDSTPSVTKSFLINTSIEGSIRLGLYIPAGEIATLTFDDETFALMQKTNFNPLSISLNDSYWDNYEPGNTGEISNRYPYLMSKFDSNNVGFDHNKKSFSFWSPFGATISIDIKDGARNNFREIDVNSPYFKTTNIKFEVSGAVEEFIYNDGLTSINDWNQQIKRVKQREITAPSFSFNSGFFSFSLPFTSSSNNPEEFSIGELNINNLVYPKKVMKKWFDFLYLSNYYARKDSDLYLKRLNMRFNNDVWGGAAAWAGGMALQAPLSWGSNSFLTGEKGFSIENWGVLHEINHNFEQNDTFFKKQSHAQTNQLNIVNNAIIGDEGRFRNELDPIGGLTGWSFLTNGFNVVQHLKKGANFNKTADEWSLYSSLLHLIGPNNYIKYEREDFRNHRNNITGWTGISEIINLSKFLELDLYYAFKNFEKYWLDWTTPNSNEKLELDKVSNDFDSVDFVNNLYAVGIYKFNKKLNKFDYTSDTTSPYEILYGKDYVFDFENNINSINDNFSWSKLNVPEKSKNGSLLTIDQNNPKKVIYHANNNNPLDIDEFDVEIFPNNFNNKPKNYVKSYKWKIKVRQSLQGASFQKLINLNNNINTQEALNALDDVNNLEKEKLFNNFSNRVFKKGILDGIKIKFKWIVPETGNYIFESNWNQGIELKLNQKIMFKSTNYSNDQFHEILTKNFKKNEIVDVELKIISKNKPEYEFDYAKTDSFGFKTYLFENNIKKEINILENSLIPNINDVNLSNNIFDYVTDQKYKYQSRYLNTVDYPGIISRILPTKFNNLIDQSNYEFESKTDPNSVNNLKNISIPGWNSWEKEDSLKINFNNITEVNGLFFGNALDEWWVRPQNLRIVGINGKNEEIELFNGKYGSQFNDRYADVTAINFNKKYLLKSLRIYFSNLINDGSDDYIRFWWIKPLSNIFLRPSYIWDLNNNQVKLNGDWTIIKNNPNNNINSFINGRYWVSSKENDEIEFESNSSGFSIIGSKDLDSGVFDVFINGKLIETIDTSNKTLLNNEILFQYINETKSKINIKIINKSKNKPIYINSIIKFS